MKLLNSKELAVLLNLKQSHIRSLVFQKKIPFIKVGHLVRFCPDQIKSWLDNNQGGQ